MNDAETPKSRLLSTATKLFCSNGIHTTGVDQIIGESGAGRLSLYKTFGSKSGLVAAALKQEGSDWRDWFFGELDAIEGGPREKLLGVFDLLGDWFRREDYFGCLFMNAVIETRNSDPKVRRALLTHKRLVLKRLAELAADAGADAPEELTQQLDLLLDGAIVKAFISRSTAPAEQAKQAAALLIDHACDPVTAR